MCGVQNFRFVATTAWIIVFFVFSTHPFLSWRIIERCVKPWVASRRHRMDIGDIVRHACGRSFPSFMLRSRRSVASRTRRTGRWSRRSLAFKRAEVARAWTAKERAKNCCQSKWSSRRRASGWHDITKSGKVWRTAKKFYTTKPAAFPHMCDTATHSKRELDESTLCWASQFATTDHAEELKLRMEKTMRCILNFRSKRSPSVILAASEKDAAPLHGMVLHFNRADWTTQVPILRQVKVLARNPSWCKLFLS